MPDPEAQAVARSMCMATGENPDQAWPRHTKAARDFVRKVNNATPANDRTARIPILGVIEDGGKVRGFQDSPAVQYAVVPADQLPAD
jgi:hypothetical protein